MVPLFLLDQYELKTDSSHSLQEPSNGFGKPIPGLPGIEGNIKLEWSSVNELRHGIKLTHHEH